MVGPSLLLLVAVGILTWALAGPAADDAPYVAPVPTEPGATGVDATGAAETLQSLVAAVSTGDRAAAAALAGRNTTVAARLTDLVDVAEAAQIESVTLRYIDDEGGLAADGTWAATVDATWAFAGFDAQPTSTEVSMRFAVPDGQVLIAGLGGGGLRTPVWMSGPLQVSRSRDLLVVAASTVDLEAYVGLARVAIPAVASVLTSWRPQLVVEVPSDGAALEAALGVESGYYAQIAAVTGLGGARVERETDHIFINRDVFADLGRAGREVVMAHEATHVATDAPRSMAPAWLVEGFADYVALRGTRLPLAKTAAQVAEEVRRAGLPSALPEDADFDTRGPHLGAVYEASWLACVVLADKGGVTELTKLYTSVSQGAPFEQALMLGFNLRPSDFIAAWRVELGALLASNR